MSIFDKLRKVAGQTVGNNTISNLITNESKSFTFSTLPENLDKMKALPEASLDSPYKTAALTVCALCAYAENKETGTELLNFLKGPQPLSNYDISFLNDRLRGQTYIPFSFFAGSTPDNDYKPPVPYKITINSNRYSFDEENYATLWIKSSGADSAREVKLRKKGEQWFLWEQFLLSGIREPKSEDPWA